MYNTDFLTIYAADKITAAQRHAWVEGLRPDRRTRFAQQLQGLAVRLQPDLASTTSAPKRRAY